jgi:hypothetical protein
MVDARRFLGVTTLDLSCASPPMMSSEKGSVSGVEASESVAYSETVELAEGCGDGALLESEAG